MLFACQMLDNILMVISQPNQTGSLIQITNKISDLEMSYNIYKGKPQQRQEINLQADIVC